MRGKVRKEKEENGEYRKNNKEKDNMRTEDVGKRRDKNGRVCRREL